MADALGRGRPSSYTPELAAEICLRLGEGETLRSICRSEHMPAWRTVYDWQLAHEEFSAAYARARDLGTDAIAEQTLEIVDEDPERIVSEQGTRVDSGYVQWQKNRVEQRLKLLAKWNPKRYGDRLEHVGAGGKDLIPVESDTELARRLLFILQLGANKAQEPST